MRKNSFCMMVAIFVGLCLVSGVVAQSPEMTSSVAEKYVILARAGAVNFVEGTVTIIREGGKSGVLLKGDEVEIGDTVSTGANGRAEVLLNPGSFVRIGGNSSFEFGSTDLEDLEIKFIAGSAMFEVFAANEFRVSVLTPKGKVSLVETGVYRIDLLADGSGSVAVTKGVAEIGDSNPEKIKDGRVGTISSEKVAVTKFDKGKRDALGEWSKSRSKELTKITSSLKNRDVGSLLLSSFNIGGWNLYSSFGVWVFNPFTRNYCFLPFGYGWYSPYGYDYRNGIYWYNLPPTVNNPNPTNPVRTKVSTRLPKEPQDPVDPSPKSNTRLQRNMDEPPPFTKVVKMDEPPPFTRVSRGGGRNDGSGFQNWDIDSSRDKSSGRSSSPSYFPHVSTPITREPPPAPASREPPPSPVSQPPVKVGTRDNN